MYIINLLGNTQVKVDFDEIEKVLTAKETLVVLRNGIVNPKHITTIVEDVERKQLVLKKPGETEADIQRRIEHDKSTNIFPQLTRTEPQLFELDKPQHEQLP